MGKLNAICVYCGSGHGDDPAFAAAAREFGRLLAERKITLVFGGGHVGLMGTVADAVLEGGGRFEGVIPQSLVDRELAHPAADRVGPFAESTGRNETEPGHQTATQGNKPDTASRGRAGGSHMYVVQTMHERKSLMADLSDAFVALPGGIGTLDELFEIWTWRQLGYHNKPIGLLDVNGFWQPLVKLADHLAEHRFLGGATRDLLSLETHPGVLLDRLSHAGE